MPRLSRQAWIAREDEYALREQVRFRAAAEAVAQAFATLPAVCTIALFGSVARPLETHVTRRGWELLHHPKDVDLAVWIDRLDDLRALNRARSAAVRDLFAQREIGVAHHQVDVFLIEPGTNAYLGRLCIYGACPKGKDECLVPGCGASPFLQQLEAFEFYPDALNNDRIVLLYQRDAAAG
jgi:predicted nucleotidyltransferase